MSSYLELNYSMSDKVQKQSLKKYFKLSSNDHNSQFIRHIYKQEACKADRIVCFSLTGGMLVDCKQTNTGYNAQGDLY